MVLYVKQVIRVKKEKKKKKKVVYLITFVSCKGHKNCTNCHKGISSYVCIPIT